MSGSGGTFVDLLIPAASTAIAYRIQKVTHCTLLRADELGLGRRGVVDGNIARATAAALEQAGVRAAKRGRRIGDYELGQLLGEGEG
jgi:hypothetical protein